MKNIIQYFRGREMFKERVKSFARIRRQCSIRPLERVPSCLTSAVFSLHCIWHWFANHSHILASPGQEALLTTDFTSAQVPKPCGYLGTCGTFCHGARWHGTMHGGPLWKNPMRVGRGGDAWGRDQKVPQHKAAEVKGYMRGHWWFTFVRQALRLIFYPYKNN